MNKPFSIFLFFVVLCVSLQVCMAQNNIDAFRIMFYNVENLFDTKDEPDKNDSEFLPGGARFWTERKLNNKLNRIFQVVVALGEGNPPAVIGLCEVENLNVLELLLLRTPLGRMGYKIVHKESPDNRGIDVALLYLPEKFSPVSYQAIPVTDPLNSRFRTRDILHVKGLMATDTIHFFVNHWPSKYGGLMETEAFRALAANTLRAVTDSIFANNQQSKLLIMGDLNDSPMDDSVIKHLNAKVPVKAPEMRQLYNLSYPLAKKGKGTIKHQGKWELIDHIIVSGTMLGEKGLTVSSDGFTIFEAGFLLEKDKTHLGMKPFRTYIGFKYNNGFSDHLPVYVDIINRP